MEKKKENELEIYWKRRDNCNKGKHKLKDNTFGITWCVICGYLSNKPSGIPLEEEHKSIWGIKYYEDTE